MKRLSRRQFLALSALGATAAATTSVATGLPEATKPWNARVSRPIRKYGDPMPTGCAGCASGCAMVAYRQQQRVASLTPARGGCPRGIEMIEALYDGERILQPLKRVGERGSGEWERIGWDEALSTLSKALQAAEGNAVADLGRPDPLAADLLGPSGFGRIIEERATRHWAARAVRNDVYGAPEAKADLSGAKTILLWGDMALDDGEDLVRATRELVQARKNGATIICVSARQGATGRFADRWIPIRPGYEALGALALAYRVYGLGVNAEAAEQALDVSLEWVYEVLADFGPAAAGSSGLDEATIDGLADRFARGRVACRTDSSALSGAFALETAVALLNAAGGVRELRPEAEGLTAVRATDSRERVLGELMDETRRVGVYFAYRANPAYAAPQSLAVAKAFRDRSRVGLLVAMDTHLTETAALADLVLPAAADLECWNLLASTGDDGDPRVVLQQPVQRWRSDSDFLRDPEIPLDDLFDGPKPGPAGAARQLGDLLVALARDRSALVQTSAEACIRAVCDMHPALCAAGGYAALSRNGHLPLSPTRRPLKIDAKPVLARLTANPPSPEAQADKLRLVPMRFLELDPAYPNSRIGREVRHVSALYLHAKTAARLGLVHGRPAEVDLEGGTITVPVQVRQTIHPEAAVLALEMGHWGSGSIAAASPGAVPLVHMDRKAFLRAAVGGLPPAPRPGPAPWWLHEGPGASVAKAAPFNLDENGAQLWRELQVTVRPA